MREKKKEACLRGRACRSVPSPRRPSIVASAIRWKKKEVGAEETQVWEDEEERLWLELPSSENSVLRSVPSIVVSLPRSSNVWRCHVTTYGWYYDDGSVQDVCSSEHMWQMLGRAVEEAVEDDALPKLRFGCAVPLRVSDLLDEDDIQSMIDDEMLTPEYIVELVYERASDVVEDGTAHLRDKAAAEQAFESVVLGTPAEILAWAVEHIELDPCTYYSGRYPLPIEYVDGYWTWGGHDEDAQAAAVITYASEPSPETGHVGWCWLALGKMGDAPTLPDAMAACMVHIRALIDGGAK